MLPDSRLCGVTQSADPTVIGRRGDFLVDTELGGSALNDATAGLQVQRWTARYESGQVLISAEQVAESVLLTVPDVQRLSLAFDQNMRPALAYETSASAYLYWYDSQAAAQVTTEFAGARDVSILLDDKRPSQSSQSDILFVYLRNRSLCYRQQRDRFLVEYVLHDHIPDGMTLNNVFMATNLRLQFVVTYEVLNG